MKNKKLIKSLVLIALAGLLIGGGTVLYMFNMPHRNVNSTKADYSITASQLVTEYLDDNIAANEKYLSEDGESKILEVTGIVAKISQDYSGQSVILLINNEDKAGVNCTFSIENNIKIENIEIGQQVKIKGVIRSGATYDEDLELYENVILDKSSLIEK